MMATMQIRVDDAVKADADALFASLGLDTSTAVRIFLRAALDNGGIPFPVRRRMSDDLREAISDARSGANLSGPYTTGDEAVRAMLAD